jgi:hypothetical protein
LAVRAVGVLGIVMAAGAVKADRAVVAAGAFKVLYHYFEIS